MRKLARAWIFIVVLVVTQLQYPATATGLTLIDTLGDDDPLKRVQAQRWLDQNGTHAIEIAIPFAAPLGDWACTTTLSVTGSVCVLSNETLETATLPTSISFLLAAGASTDGPRQNILSWIIAANTATGLSHRLLAVTPVQLPSGDWQSCLNDASFSLVLHSVSLRALSEGDTYWLVTHAVFATTSTTRFYWALSSTAQKQLPPGTTVAFLRDRSNLLGQQWETWTPLTIYDQYFYPNDGLSNAMHPLLPSIRVVAPTCNGTKIIDDNISSAISPPPLSSPESSPSPPSLPLPSPVSSPSPAPSSVPVPSIEYPFPDTDTRNETVVSPSVVSLDTIPTLILVGIIIVSIGICAIILIIGVISIRRWRDRVRIRDGYVGGREFLQGEEGSFMPIDTQEDTSYLAQIRQATRTSHDDARNPGEARITLPRKSSASRTTNGTLSRSSGSVGNLNLTNVRPWIPANEIFTEIPLGDLNRPSSSHGSARNSPRSVGLIQDDDEDGNIVPLISSSRTPRESPRAGQHRTNKMRKTSSSGDVRNAASSSPRR